MQTMLFFLFRILESIKCRWYNFFTLPCLKKTFKTCGNNFTIAKGYLIAGNKNMSFGNNVYIGPQSILYSTLANIYIGNHVIAGPRLCVLTGDHRFNVIGEYIDLIDDHHKLPENDKDVIIEDDVWLGINVTILKGVTIGHGSVIAACATVVKDVPPYSIYITKDKIYPRFTKNEIVEHEKILNNKYKN